jgi:hypothetical protein
LYATIAVLAATVVAPRARRALRALDSEGPKGSDYVSYRATMRKVSPFISLGTLAIVVLMVLRPR